MASAALLTRQTFDASKGIGLETTRQAVESI
jgi:hypothetical protein